MTIGVSNHISTGQSMCDNDSGFADGFLNEVADEVCECLSGIINGWMVREAKAHQINGIDAKLLGQGINILTPLIRRGPRSEAMNEQKRSGFTCSLDLVIHIAIFPGIAALLPLQYRVELTGHGLRHPVENTQCSERTPNREASGKQFSSKSHVSYSRIFLFYPIYA